NTYVGASPGNTKNWRGSVADLKMYGASGTGSAGSAAEVKNDFKVTANQFRATPVEDIVTSGAVLHLDAANAKQGVSRFANGCAPTDLNWFDLSTANLTGALTGFAGCGASSGWNGSGTAAEPYRLNFDGLSDYVQIPKIDLTTTNQVSVSFWYRPDAIALSVLYEFSTDFNLNPRSFAVFLRADGTFRASLKANVGYTTWSSTTVANTSTWYHVVAVFDLGLTTNEAQIYVNGAFDGVNGGNDSDNNGNFSNYVSYMGSRAGSSLFNSGSIAQLSVYNRVLSPAEIKQNCHAQKARFSGATCAAP
ncbi:MAG: LamG domain-containing protein, partial [Bdellovibrionota bacterium]